MTIASQAATAADKVLMVVSSHATMGNTEEKTGYWLSELTHPYAALKNAGLDITIASIDGGKAPIDPRSLEDLDAETERFLDGDETRQQIEHTPALASLKAEDYRAILFVGGHGAMWDFPHNDVLQSLTVAIYQAEGVVAAVCHGPAGLTTLTLPNGDYLIAGKQVTGFSNAEEDAIQLTDVVPFSLEDQLKAASGLYHSSAMWEPEVVVDGRIVTGRNPASAHGVGEAVAQLLSE